MEADEQRRHEGNVWQTLRRIAAELDRLQIEYAVVGGLALQSYGFERSTQDVDLLLDSADDLSKLHASVVGRGYQRKSPTSRHLRDEISRVRVEFLIAGEFPGDGLPKPVRFPRPHDASARSDDGVRVIDLRSLIEMKLASAKSAAHRIKDRSDVLELIHLLKLPADYATNLDPYVSDEFRALAVLPPPFERDD